MKHIARKRFGQHFLSDGGIGEYEDEAEYAPKGCVSFLTVHQSKGLEFPVVALPCLSGVVKGNFDKLVYQPGYGIAFNTARSSDDEKPGWYQVAGYLDKQADALFRQVLPRIWDRPGKGTRETLIYAVSCFGFMLGDQGHVAEADGLFDRAEALDPDAQTAMRPSLLTQRAAMRLWQGEWQQAEALANAALRDCQQSHTRYLAMKSHVIGAYARWQIDGSAREVARMEDCARWFLSPGNSRQRTSLTFGWLTEVMAARRDLAAARGYAGAMVQRIREGGDRLGESMAWRALAGLEQARGQTARADHYLRLAQRSAELRASPREAAQNQLCAARLALARGDADAAARLAAEAASAFAALGIDTFSRMAAALVPNR